MIYILPYAHLESLHAKKTNKAFPDNFLWKNKEHLFFFNGKTAIHYLINKYKLKRDDEVCIFTSSDKNYVSTCVSATIFNYSKIARIVTEHTKMLYVIHEFGVVHPAIEKIVELGKRLNIPVVEDCAHTVLSSLNGKRAGEFGDYAIYSLPKQIPVNHGGLLVGNDLKKDKRFYDSQVATTIEKEFYKYNSLIPLLSERRKRNFNKIRIALKKHPVAFELDKGIVPYFIIFVTARYKELYEELNGKVAEWGRTYVNNWFCVPTQPLMSATELSELQALLKIYLK
jgi:hypothetical protein